MKFKYLLPAFLLLCSVSQAQELKIDAGLGVGTFIDDWSFGPGKVLATTALNYRTDTRFDFSADFLITGQMGFSDRTPFLSAPNADFFDNRLANLTNVMLLGRYKFAIKDPRRYFFLGAGPGLSHVSQRVDTNDTRRVSKNNFIVGIESGIVRNNVTLGLRWTSNITTPGFQEVNQVDGREVVYSEVTFMPIMFYAKYDIVRIWGNR